MNRRNFLRACIAVACAPAVARSSLIEDVVPDHVDPETIVPTSAVEIDWRSRIVRVNQPIKAIDLYTMLSDELDKLENMDEPRIMVAHTPTSFSVLHNYRLDPIERVYGGIIYGGMG